MCDLAGDERAEVFEEEVRRARKEHRCECCRRTIAVGERYARTFVVFEGEPDSAKACLACHRAIQRFGKAHRFYPFPSSFAECLEQCIDERDDGYQRWQRELRALAKRRVA